MKRAIYGKKCGFDYSMFNMVGGGGQFSQQDMDCHILVRISKFFHVIFFLFISLNMTYILGAQKNHLKQYPRHVLNEK